MPIYLQDHSTANTVGGSGFSLTNQMTLPQDFHVDVPTIVDLRNSLAVDAKYSWNSNGHGNLLRQILHNMLCINDL